MKLVLFFFGLCLLTSAITAAEPVVFQARTTSSGNWSDPKTWEGGRLPQAGDFVQVREGHSVIYDVLSRDALRMVHVAGTLTFSREKSTLLEVGLIKIEPGETTTEDGFDCHAAPPAVRSGHAHGRAAPPPVLEIGTPDSPLPVGVKATIRLRHFKGTNSETLPAIVSCGGRWDVHGAPLRRTWLKLASPANAGDSQVTLEQPAEDWRVGDRIILTTCGITGVESGASFQKRQFGRQKPVGTEERVISSVAGAMITLDRPLDKPHHADGWTRCEVANLSRNVVIESADPGGVRGHTMYHHGSSGGISYAEFRHLGKDGVLGKYAIHFHLVRDTMRGSGVLGASIWDSHNRWITVHGTDHLLIRDCVGYQSRGHGYFLEDATEQWNVFDRNLAVQSFGSIPLPKQVLAYDPNDGAGFWWANGRNTFTRNVACENDRYGYHFHLAQAPGFEPVLPMRDSEGKLVDQDVRTLPFFRFEDNESHGEGLFDFRFGDETPGVVRGDREHPFIVRNLRAWDSHYVLRPNAQCFLLEGLRVKNAAFGIYHPNYDAHVYRDIELDRITAEPLNGGHDEGSFPRGSFTYERLTFANCQLGSDPLIQLTCIAPQAGLSGHFRGITLANSKSGTGVVNFGGGPRTNKTEHPVGYYFHDTPAAGLVIRAASAKIPAAVDGRAARLGDGWLGGEVRAEEMQNVPFPQLLAPIDDLPPATLITSVLSFDGKRTVRGVSHDNGEIAEVVVNGGHATITAQHAGVADWTITIDGAASRIVAQAKDRSGNTERVPHERIVP